MIILDSTYFQGELHIAGLTKRSTSVGVSSIIQAVNENTLEWYAAKYEIEFLNKVLHQKLAKNFIAGLSGSDPEIWVEMKKALVVEIGVFSYSPIANYVYFYLSRRGRTQTTMKGEVKATQDYAVNVDDADKLSKIWNDMYYNVKDFYLNFLKPNWNTYKSYADRFPCNDFETINALDV